LIAAGCDGCICAAGKTFSSGWWYTRGRRTGRSSQYAPLPLKPGDEIKTDGIIAFSYQVSDDGNYALVEFVAHDKAAFKQILADQSPTVKAFVKGRDKLADVITAFKQLKKDFDINTFEAAVQ
jgi:hypothetical protein